MRCRRRMLVLVAALLSVVPFAACTGVPDSSAPQTVQPVTLQPDEGTESGPRRDVSARTIVSDFLDANASAPAQRGTARAYLTASARNQWSDQKVTVVADQQIKTYDSRSGSLEVTGRVVGTINAEGIYQPSLQDDGNGGRATPFPFTLKQVNGQYRIDELRSGLLITVDQFRQKFQQRVLYFNDLSGHRFVPDVRWTAIPITDSVPLARWLVTQLVTGPRPDEADSVGGNTFPAQADADRILVRATATGALRIEIPGSSQLSGSARDALALQLSRTLDDVGSSLTITDAGAPVSIPAAGTTTFDLATLEPSMTLTPQAPDLYYLDNGQVTAANGKALAGPLGADRYFLSSVALAERSTTPDAPLAAAGVQLVGSTPTLYVGTTTAGLSPTKVVGTTSRPAWTPGVPEVWVGVGKTLHRLDVNASGTSAKDSVVQLPTTAGSGNIVSVRVSPDATQLSLVVAGPGQDGGQLYVGAIVRDAGVVRVSTLVPISPAGVQITDADWKTSTRLSAIGAVRETGQGSVFETGVDGSFWQNRGIGSLPAAPVSITTSPYGNDWVEAGSQVWQQNGSTWRSATSFGQSTGRAPVYVAES